MFHSRTEPSFTFYFQFFSQINWSAEEDEFRKLAFGELPRFTLSDDETLHAFEEKSIWEIAPNNNPLYEAENKKLEIKGTKKTNINLGRSFESPFKRFSFFPEYFLPKLAGGLVLEVGALCVCSFFVRLFNHPFDRVLIC